MKFQEDHPNHVLLEVMNPSDNGFHIKYYQCFYFLIQCFLFPTLNFNTKKKLINYTE